MAKWGDKVTTSRCNNCGTEVYFEKSASGSSYPANVFRGNASGVTHGMPRALPNKPHTSEECQAEQAATARGAARETEKTVASAVAAHPDYLKASEGIQKAGMSGDVAAVTAAVAHMQETHARLTKELTPQYTDAPKADKPKGFANKYAGKCVGCGNRVESGEGLTSKGAAGWEVRCVGCHHGA